MVKRKFWTKNTCRKKWFGIPPPNEELYLFKCFMAAIGEQKKDEINFLRHMKIICFIWMKDAERIT